jgi:hypothetical protein
MRNPRGKGDLDPGEIPRAIVAFDLRVSRSALTEMRHAAHFSRCANHWLGWGIKERKTDFGQSGHRVAGMAESRERSSANGILDLKAPRL